MIPVSPRVILCVDDEPTGLMARRLILSIAGYDVLTAASAEAALRIFSRNPVDLIITDHFLPDLPGTEMAAMMKRLKPQVPIVLLTGSLEPPPGIEHTDLLLVKGMPPPEFLAAVARLLTKENGVGSA